VAFTYEQVICLILVSLVGTAPKRTLLEANLIVLIRFVVDMPGTCDVLIHVKDRP